MRDVAAAGLTRGTPAKRLDVVGGSDEQAMLTRLADEATGLGDEPYDSAKFKLWRQRARDFVGGAYGDAFLRMFNSILFFPRAFTTSSQAQQMHRERIDKAIEFFTVLQAEDQPERPPEDTATRPLSLEDLHPEIVKACGELYRTGQLAVAVERSVRVVRERLAS